MKYLILAALLGLQIMACKPAKEKEVTTEPEVIVSTDSGAVAPKADSLQMNPETDATTMQQDPPTSTPVVTNKECNPNFSQIGAPKKSTYFYYATGFNVEEFKCWSFLEAHGKGICNGRPCTVIYLDRPNAHIGDTAPNYIDAATLMNYGIAKYTYNGKFWEVKGAREWMRKGNGYGYFNTDNHLGG
ncbi:MAG: hypothetical protein M3R25_11350 [Bacteroidota bacterium]|nr:hypothetical protein [Bacteroidota bacterium]